VVHIRLIAATIVTLSLAVGAACGSSADTTSETATTTTSQLARPSSGCARPDAAFAAVGAAGTISNNGTDRAFTLEVPPDSPADQPLPLVIDMHGALMDRGSIETMSRFSELGAREGFVVITPQALGDKPIWDLSPSGRDVSYVEGLIDDVEQKLCIDTARVYLTGFSMGGMMSMVLACRQPERYAAIAPVAGVNSVDDCARAVPVPLLAFQGTADSDVQFDGSLSTNVAALVPYTSGLTREQIVQTWALANGCGVPARDTALPPDVEQEVYDCPQNGSVEMYVIKDGGHTWPGSNPGPYSEAIAGKTTQTIDATELIWTFFQQHTRPG
jgi:polyhydroxybutyrate depolymerase